MRKNMGIYRGKRTANGEWVVGNLEYDKDLDTAWIIGYEYYTGDQQLQREPFAWDVDPENGFLRGRYARALTECF